MSLMSHLPPQAPVPFVRLLLGPQHGQPPLEACPRYIQKKTVLFGMFNMSLVLQQRPIIHERGINDGTQMCTSGCEKGLEES